MLVLGGLFFILFAVVEKKLAKIPMIPMRLFSQGPTTVIYLQSALYNAVWQIDMYFLPIYFQDVRGYSALKSAALILPLLLFQSLFGVISGPVMTKIAR